MTSVARDSSIEEHWTTARRRHGQGLQQPLLAEEESPDDTSEPDVGGDEARAEGFSIWRDLIGTLLTGWSSIFATIGSALMRISPIPGWCREQQASLSVLQEARLHQLQQSVVIPFDAENEEHEEALRALWRHAFPGEPLQDLVTPEWTRMGWQGPNPGTDFRGAGFLSLHNLVALAERYPDDFASLLHKTKGTRAKMEYPFAVAGLNLTFMLLTLLGLHRDKLHNRSEGAWRGFVRLLEVEERAFDELYRLTFLLLDRLWLVFEADYMDFQMVLAATRSRLEQVLSSPNITCIADVHTGLFANIEEIQRPMQRRR